ncbi:MAG: hypothetical protein CMJ32_05930 [Phycisphaerae bacterium]|nr:hypothetical protein [Phycisphaerae bacterium]
MSPESRRIIIPIAVALMAGGVLLTTILQPGKAPAPVDDETVTDVQVDPAGDQVAQTTDPATGTLEETSTNTADVTEARVETPDNQDSQQPTGDTDPEGETADATTDGQSGSDQAGIDSSDDTTSGLKQLRARAPTGGFSDDDEPESIGSLDPENSRFRITFTGSGAGLENIVFSDFWINARDNRQAQSHRRAVESGASDVPPLPDESQRYVLQTLQSLKINRKEYSIPLLGMRSIRIDQQEVSLFGNVWSQVEPGIFTSEIVDGDDAVIARVTRGFRLLDDQYHIQLEQRVTNLSGRSLKVQWMQYGPGDLSKDRSSFVEVRRYHFGYLLPVSQDPQQETVIAQGQLYDRQEIIDQVIEGDPAIWPNKESIENEQNLSWFGTTNRYFTLAIFSDYAPPDQDDKSISGSVNEIFALAGGSAGTQESDRLIVTEIHSPEKVVEPGAEGRFDIGVYAGPLDRTVLGVQQPYKALNMQAIIVYLMSGCCTFCTFSWLANFLVWFLTFLHDNVVFDWAIAIIVLVVVVRLLLHPLMKKSQISMQRMSRMMTELKPELDALQRKYGDDKRKLQEEQMRLYREKGLNPLGCAGGFLPMLLQMPIWIALYAMLFFAFELRQEPAFWGVFQLIGNWPFLADLAAPDHFFGEFEHTYTLFFWNLTGLNLLPLLMGAVFFFQQKYMSPPPSPNMSPEQLQQQKIMKIMIPIMFPIMLYTAPSGLTLYILTSSTIGVVEGYFIRKQVEQMDLSPKARKTKKKPKDSMGRMYAEALERAKDKRSKKQNANFKKRK